MLPLRGPCGASAFVLIHHPSSCPHPHHGLCAWPHGCPLSFWITSPTPLLTFQKAHPALCPHPFAPQLVMEDIFISGDPLLESVGLHEPLVEDLRATIANTVRKAMVPLQAYAKEYRKFLELNNTDIATFLKCVHASECVCVSV